MNKLTIEQRSDLIARFRREADLDESVVMEPVLWLLVAAPFRIMLDETSSIRALVGDVIAQAMDRQLAWPGTHYGEAALQHLVGAQLDCSIGKGKFTHKSFRPFHALAGRPGNFLLGDSAIHVTTAPNEALIAKCEENVIAGMRPIIVTVKSGASLAKGLADNKGLSDAIDIFEIEQFVALKIYTKGNFTAKDRKTALTDLITRYNEIIDEVETDLSLKIELWDQIPTGLNSPLTASASTG